MLTKIAYKIVGFHIFFWSFLYFFAYFPATCMLFIEIIHDAHCTLHTAHLNPIHSIADCNIMYDVRKMSAPLHTMHFGCNMQLFVRWIFFSFHFSSSELMAKELEFDRHTLESAALHMNLHKQNDAQRSKFQWCNNAMYRRIVSF